jgi:molecular chaperone GrpE
MQENEEKRPPEALQGAPEDTSEDASEDAREKKPDPPQPISVDALGADEGGDGTAGGASAEETDWQEQYKRLAADFANFKRNHTEELKRAQEAERGRIFTGWLEVVDNMERAMALVEAEDANDAFVIGVKGILQQMLQVLTDSGVETIDAADVPFNVDIHEAVSMVEDKARPDGTVAQVFQKGYRQGNQLLRPARVVVTRGGGN